MKIAICIPAYGDTKAKFTQSLADLLIHMHSAQLIDPAGRRVTPEVALFMVACSMLTQSRHKLVAEAIFWGADYMLWLDADHIFPPDAFARLWARNRAVVGCNYARRCIPTAPTACAAGEGSTTLVYTTEAKAKADAVEEVSHMGFGLCLIHMHVFDLLQAHAEARGDPNFLPLFHFEATHGHVVGEDVFFFAKLRDAGVTAWVDHALSWEIGHIHETIMTNAHADAQRVRWHEQADRSRRRYDQKAAALEEAIDG